MDIFCLPHLHSTPPLGGLPSEHRHPVWYEKSRMVWLPDCEKISKISLFVLTQLTNVTDTQTDRHTHTDTAWRHRSCLCIASPGKNLVSYFNSENHLSFWLTFFAPFLKYLYLKNIYNFFKYSLNACMQYSNFGLTYDLYNCNINSLLLHNLFAALAANNGIPYVSSPVKNYSLWYFGLGSGLCCLSAV